MAQREVIAKQGQTIFDIVNQEYGDINFVHDFLELNGITLNYVPKTTEVLLVDTDNVGDQKAKDYFNKLNDKQIKIHVPVNYVEDPARDFFEEDYDTDDYA